jgi:hypothetical protein
MGANYQALQVNDAHREVGSQFDPLTFRFATSKLINRASSSLETPK